MTTATAFVAGAALGAGAAGAAAWSLIRRRAARFERLFSFAMHEINTPVTAVNMTVLNLLSEVFGPLPVPLKPWLEMAREQVGRLNSLAGELRDFVHMELRKDLRADLTSVSPAELVESALGSIRCGMEQAGVAFSASLPADLPVLRTDSERASRCLTSMLFHARKFRVAGSVTLRAQRTRGPLSGRGVDFTVLYSGPPMTPASAAACLDLYYPARNRHVGESQDHVLAATGLGLGLLRAVARRMGGDLDFRVADMGRAAVTLSLPEEERQ